MVSFIFVSISSADDLQKEYTNIKIALEVLKNNEQQQKDNDKEIKQNIKELENKINSFEKKIEIASQRFDDFNSGIGFYLSIYGVLITLLLVFGYFWSVSKTKEQIKQWLDEKGNEELKRLSNDAQEKINNHVIRLEKDTNDIRQTYEKQFREDMNQYKEVDIPKLNEDIQNILKESEQTRSYSQWDDLFQSKISNKEYQKALEVANKMKEYYPDVGYFYIGIAYNKLQEHKEAINAYRKSIEVNPKRYEAYNNMGITYVKLQEHKEAINVYQKAIELKPKDDDAYINYFEVCLIANIKIKSNIEEYLQNNTDKKTKMAYQMLLLFLDIDKGKDVDIEQFFTNHQNDLNSLKTWGFDELETWAKSQVQSKQAKLLETIEAFKIRLGQK